MREGARAIVVWRFADGRRGHENQVDGLVDALARLVPVSVHTIATPAWQRLRALAGVVTGRALRMLAVPDLLVGAGHATHWPMLAARRRVGGRAVVLMRPSLPLAWFDLCVVPEHDGVAPSPNVLLTRGALNRLHPAAEKAADEGLVLVGGPSRHLAFDEAAVCARIEAIAQAEPRTRWRVVESRRTPVGLVQTLAAKGLPNVEVVRFEAVDADWLPGALARSATAWVTADSVSMVYEALSAGAATGIVEVTPPAPSRGTDRIARGLAGLREEGLVASFEDWRAGRALAPPTAPLDEAGRCARWILDRWLAARA